MSVASSLYEIVIQAVDQFSAGFNSVIVEAQGAAGAMTAFGGSWSTETAGLGASLNQWGIQSRGLAEALWGASFATTAVGVAGTQAFQSMYDAAEKYQRSLITMEAVTHDNIAEIGQLNDIAQQVADQGFFSVDMVTNANAQARAVGLTTAQIAELAPTVAALAVVWGTDYQTAMNAVRLSIVDNNNRMVESIGLNLKAATVADSLGVSVGALTSQYTRAEMEQIKINLALQQGAYALQAVGAVGETSTGAVARMNASLQTLDVTLGNDTAPIIANAADLAKTFLDAINALPGPIQQLGVAAGMLVSELANMAGPIFFMVAALPGLARAMGTIINLFTEGTLASDQQIISTNENAIAQSVLTGAFTAEDVERDITIALQNQGIAQTDAEIMAEQSLSAVTATYTGALQGQTVAFVAEKYAADAATMSTAAFLAVVTLGISLIVTAGVMIYTYKDQIMQAVDALGEWTGALRINQAAIDEDTTALDTWNSALAEVVNARTAEANAEDAVATAQTDLAAANTKLEDSYATITKEQEQYDKDITDIVKEEDALIKDKEKLTELMNDQIYAQNQLSVAQLVYGAGSEEAIIDQDNLALTSQKVADQLVTVAGATNSLTSTQNDIASVTAKLQAYNDWVTNLAATNPTLYATFMQLQQGWTTNATEVDKLNTALIDYMGKLGDYNSAVSAEHDTQTALNTAYSDMANSIATLISKYPDLAGDLGTYTSAANLAATSTSTLSQVTEKLTADLDAEKAAADAAKKSWEDQVKDFIMNLGGAPSPTVISGAGSNLQKIIDFFSSPTTTWGGSAGSGLQDIITWFNQLDASAQNTFDGIIHGHSPGLLDVIDILQDVPVQLNAQIASWHDLNAAVSLAAYSTGLTEIIGSLSTMNVLLDTQAKQWTTINALSKAGVVPTTTGGAATGSTGAVNTGPITMTVNLSLPGITGMTPNDVDTLADTLADATARALRYRRGA